MHARNRLFVIVLVLFLMLAVWGKALAGPPTAQQCWDEDHYPTWAYWVSQGWCPEQTNPFKTWRW